MNQSKDSQSMARPSAEELRTIITKSEGAKMLVYWADRLGKQLKDSGLSTNQIRALYGEVRQIQAEWTIERRRQQALRRLILLKPKMAYRAGKEKEKGRDGPVSDLVSVLRPALDLVVEAKPKEQSKDSEDNQDDNYQRFVEFFEAILAYHKAYGGK